LLALLVSVLVAFAAALPTTAGNGVGGVISAGSATSAASTTSSPAAKKAVPTTSPAPTTRAAPTTRVAPTPVAPAPDPRKVASAVGQAVQNAADDGVTEQVVVLNRTSGALIASANSDDAVPSVSAVKLFLALDVIDSAGGVSNVTASTLANLSTMIATSDDAIAQDVYDDYGGNSSIERVIDDYGLTGSSPSPNAEYWGDVRSTAADVASLLYQALSAKGTGSWLASAMTASTDTAADGFDQAFGLNAIRGAGSKQGWGCCLGGVVALHSAGFTANEIIVVLSTSYPDQDWHDLQSAAQLAADRGAKRTLSLVTATAKAAATGVAG